MEHELTFHQIVDGISALITVTTADGDVALVNQQVLDYFGKSLDELKRWTATDAVHPDDLPGVVAAWQRSVRLGQPYELEHRIRRADGEYRWFHVRGLPVRDPTGRIVRWFVLHTDIHARKRAEALLAGEKQLLESVASGIPLQRVLEALCRLVECTEPGCNCSVVVLTPDGSRIDHVVSPSLPARYNEALAGRDTGREGGPCTVAARRKTQIIVSDVASDSTWDRSGWRALVSSLGLGSCWATPILRHDSCVLGTFAIYRREPASPTPDQQELIDRFTHVASIAIGRSRSEEALKRSEAFLAEAQHLSRTGSYWCRLSTNEITWSKEMYRIYEWDESEPITRAGIDARVHPEDRAMYREQVARSLDEPTETDFQTRLQFPNGSIKHIHVVSHPSRNDSGDVEYTGAVQDITDRRRAEDALAKLQSELAHVSRVTTLGALTASIAHEVNQPLSGIITNASTCLRMLADDPPNLVGARETAQRTIRDGRRASDVIARLRALFAKKETTTEPVDLNDATREVIALTLSDLQRNRVIVRQELADDLPCVAGDRVQLQQVILNLVLNASQAMRDIDDRPRELTVKTQRAEGEHVRLTVRDAGVGFAPEDAEKLFETLYTTKSGGMGIGLSVSRTIVESHGGRLWATRNEGPGATFTFSIPCAPKNVIGTCESDGLDRGASFPYRLRSLSSVDRSTRRVSVSSLDASD